MHLYDLEPFAATWWRWPCSISEARRTSPTQAGELYERSADDWCTITLDELRTAEWLGDGVWWVASTLAQQAVSRRLARQGGRG